MNPNTNTATLIDGGNPPPGLLPMGGMGFTPPAPQGDVAQKQARLDELRKRKRLAQLREMKAAAQPEAPTLSEPDMIADMRTRLGDDRANQILSEREQVKAGNPLDLEKRANAELSPMERFAESRPMSAIAGVGQGVSMGFNDELAGAAAAIIPGGDGYGEARDKVRQANNALSEMHPKSFMAGELGGGLASGGAGMGRNALSTGYRQAVAQGAKTGAVYGGAYGVGTAEGGMSNRLQGGGVGALAGGLGGAALQPATRFIGNRLASIGTNGAATRADAIILRQVMQTHRIDRPNALAMIRDVDPSDPQLAFQKLGLEGLAQGNGGVNAASSKIISDAVIAQQRGQQRRISDSVKRIMGADDFTTLSNDAAANLRNEGSQLYEAVLGEPISNTPALTELLARPSMRKAMTRARRMMADSGESGGDDLATYQAAKEALDDVIGAHYRAGKSKQAGVALKLQRELLSELDAQVPGYARARSVWSGQRANQNALEYGRNALKLRPEDVARDTANYSQAERQHLLAGVLQGVDDRLKKASLSHDATTRFNAEGLRDVFRTVLTDKQANRIVSLLDGESAMTASGRAVRMGTGSQTASRQQNIAEVRRLTSGPVGRAFSKGMDVAASPRASISDAIRFIGSMGRREKPAVVEALMLRLAGTPEELASAMDALATPQRARAERLIKGVEARAGIAAGVAVN